MASLETISKNIKEILDDGIAYVAIYKDGRSWNYYPFIPDNGSYDDGYELYEDDMFELYRIVNCDYKAICVCGYYYAFDNLPVYKIMEKIKYNYDNRLNQLDGDFLQCMVSNLR